jgi:hypothetical protein
MRRYGGFSSSTTTTKGLYICHPPGDHDAWAASKKKTKEINIKLPEYTPSDPLFGAYAHTVDGAGGGI